LCFLAQDPLGPALAALHASHGDASAIGFASIAQVVGLLNPFRQLAKYVAIQQVISQGMARLTGDKG
jgi:hypothetical protein